MGRLFRLIMYLLVLGFLALIGFAYIGDLSPNRVETRVPVELNGD